MKSTNRKNGGGEPKTKAKESKQPTLTTDGSTITSETSSRALIADITAVAKALPFIERCRRGAA